MKTKYYINMVISVLFILCYGLTDLNADPIQKKGRSRVKVYYEKLNNNDKQITVILNQGSGKQMTGITNAEVFITSFDLDNEVALATLVTDENGEAILVIEADYKLPKNEAGYTVIKALYKGNDTLKEGKKQIKFMDVDINIAFDIVDSVKQITLSTFQKDSLGNSTPITGVELNIGVERLYSILYLDEIKSDKNGVAVMEFPNDIPGDSIGNLNLIIKIIESKKYGTVSKTADIQWGTIVDYTPAGNGRSLFGDEAPLWMILSVFIILAGAWFHFILAIYKVFSMWKLAKDETPADI